MAELEKKSGTIKPQEDCIPRHGRGVDPNSIKKGSIHENQGSE